MIARCVRGHFEKFPNHREVRVHNFESGRQCIFEGDIILQLPRLHSVSDEQLVTEFERRVFFADALRISEIFHDTLDAEAAIDAIGIEIRRGIFRLHQKR